MIEKVSKVNVIIRHFRNENEIGPKSSFAKTVTRDRHGYPWDREER